MKDSQNKQFKYIEVVAYAGRGNIIKRYDVTGKTQRQIDTFENGLNRNMNHKDYYTREKDSKIELATI